MSKSPWITIVGIGEDGPAGLSSASHKALQTAEIIMGSSRHLSLLDESTAKVIEWPIPFSDGLPILASYKGRNVVVLASGDPFWFGAGSSIARTFKADEWQSYPAPSTFSIAANRLGWALDKTTCLGLHAVPMTRLRPYLAPNARCLVLLRDGASVMQLADYLLELGFKDSDFTVMEALGGAREKTTQVAVQKVRECRFQHPVCVGLDVRGRDAVLPVSSGLPDELFETDGVMTKRAVRALTLSALAPKAGEMLWDIGGGSGSIAIEWLLAHSQCEAISFEPRADRVALIQKNAESLGVDRLKVVVGSAPEILTNMLLPDAVFIGGGLSVDMIDALEELLPSGTRVVANAVTLETESVLVEVHKCKGGDLTRMEMAQAHTLGAKTAWKSTYPVVQWSGTI